MEQVTVTAKVQISVSEADRVLLDSTMSAYRKACNFVSGYVFRTHELNQRSLNRVLYRLVREKFGLKAQMAQSVLKTVVARYKTILENDKVWRRPVFKKPQLDLVWNRDYSLTKSLFSVNTLGGRVKLPYFTKGMEKYFNKDVYKFGTAKLVSKHRKYFLHIPATCHVEESKTSEISHVVGVDRGINFVVATYDSNRSSGFVNGKALKQKRAKYSKLRKDLQKRQTPSARRRLKAIGHRENRWMQDVNHQVSKALVQNNPKHTLFVLEDLEGVRSATEKVKTKYRYVHVSWAFFDLEQKLMYKAKLNLCSVLKVDPAYTSQCCPICGHIEKGNRDKRKHLFSCRKCGYRSNDDRIGAMNLYQKGIGYLKDSQVPDTVTAEQGSAVRGGVNHPAM